MTVLIDPPNVSGHGRWWSHLVSDLSHEELHRFADELGIPRRGFDRDHYDIPAERYDDVVAAGASPVSSRELLERLRAAGLRRRKSQTLAPRRPGRALLRAERLHAGDRVAVVAPAGPVPTNRLAEGVRVLESWGLEVVVGAHAGTTYDRLPHLAAADADRAADLTAAWTDPAVQAVVCARGGYGSQRMVDLLDWQLLAHAGPKILLGFSDITGLHQAFGARLGLSTLHGPVVTSLGAADGASAEHLRRLLFEPASGLSLTPHPATTLVPGEAEGVLVGGNLTLLASEIGTGTAMSVTGSILMVEEVGEAPYRIDRMLTQLLRSGWLEEAAAVAVGSFVDCGDPDVVRALLVDRLGSLGVPVLTDLAFGHDRPNLAFPLGVRADLVAGDREGSLVVRDTPLL